MTPLNTFPLIKMDAPASLVRCPYWTTLFFLVLLCGPLSAQPWIYDFGTTTGSHTSGVSTTFLPSTPVNGGIYRVRVGTAGGGFTLANPGTTLGTGSELQINAATSTSTNKFTVYDWSAPSPQAYMKFKLRTTSSGNGSLYFHLGSGAGVFQDNIGATSYGSSLATFWITYGSGAITSVTRRNLTANTDITTHGFQKDADQEIEVYGNNAGTASSYGRAGTIYQLAAQSWDLWVNGVKVSPANGWARAGIGSNVNLAGIGFFAENSAANAAFLYLDDLEYSNTLPTSTPTIDLPSPGSLTGFQTPVGTPSDAQSFSVSASNLGADLVITAPAGYELRQSPAGTYANTISISPVSGAASLTVDVRLTGAVVGVYNGNVTITSTNATSRTVALEGEVIEGGILDCEGIVDGPALPGTPCDDGDLNTLNDTWSADCECEGVPVHIYWNFNTATPTINTVPFTTVPALVHGNNNGTTILLTTTSPSTGYVGASGGNNAGVAARTGPLDIGVNGSAYFEFTITPDAGYAVTVHSISFGSRRTSTGPLAYSIRSSSNGYLSDIASGTFAANTNWALHLQDGLNTSSFSGEPITFRIYGHSGTGSASVNTANWRIDDLDVVATVMEQEVVPVVGFVEATSSHDEDAGTAAIDVSMNIAPASTVIVEIIDAGTGTATAGVNYTFAPTQLTFQPGDTYPMVQQVNVTLIDDAIYGPDLTVMLDLAVVQGSAATSLTSHLITIVEDDLPMLVINEVDYDQPGADTEEFIELMNTGATAIDLAGIELILVNGANEQVYSTTSLPSVVLPAGGYYVVCYGPNTLPYCDLTVTGAIQNGDPDGIRLATATGAIIDQMSYGGEMSTTEGSSAPTISADFEGLGLSRIPNGSNTGDNSVDFWLACITPGEANVWEDSDGDGVNDCMDLCPGGPEPGTACDDGDPNTVGDVIQADCTCAGVATDCEGVAGGPALPGTPCDDQDPSTVNDVYQEDCTCAGEAIDCLGTPGGTALPGTACDDGDPDTINDTWTEQCVCIGTPTGPCTQDIVLELQTDANGDQTSWEILSQGAMSVMCDGSGYPNNSVVTVDCCVPDGCYVLRVYDSAGDGMASGQNGGYILRMSGANGARIIDNRNNFLSGSVSAIANDQGFCLPIGTDRVIFTSCDKLDWVDNQFIVASLNPDVSAQWVPNAPNSLQDANSGYQFWFYDPNGTYSFRWFRRHSNSHGFGVGPARAAHLRINNWLADFHIPEGVLMNVRVRGVVNGEFLEWGPACRFKIDPVAAQCPTTKLMDIPWSQFLSCGQYREWAPNSYVHARPVSGATQYQFRFRQPAEGFEVVRTNTSYFTQLWWVNNPLVDGSSYEVDVRAFRNGQWCPWGDVCTLNIGEAPGMAQDGASQNLLIEGNTAELNMWPNPNNGDQLYLSLSEVPEGVYTITVDMFDLYGKRVMARTIAVNDGFLNTVLDLQGDLAAGMYMVNITAGELVYTKRLVMQR